MLQIDMKAITKVFPSAGRGGTPVRAVNSVDCTIQPGEIFFLLGPSGCGKTTLLRILAGFVTPTSGQLFFDGKDVTNVGAEKRQLAMVFQNYALWPHMTVAKNVEFGPRTAGWPGPKRKEAVARMLAMVGMEDRRNHKPPQLSGGQQQRVALARAMAIQPRGLLLDEPLSNLDARLRARMRGEIRRMVKDVGATAVYVTHDQEEALSMADRIAVMNEGRIVQIGTPREVYRRPANRFVADFLGEANFLESTVAAQEGELWVLNSPAGPLRVRHQGRLTHGAKVVCCIRPEAIRLRVGATSPADNIFSVRCLDSVYMGHMTRYNLELGCGQSLRSVTLQVGPPVTPGQAIEVSFSVDDVVVLTD